MGDRSTILERLRGNSSQWAPLMREAADEIEAARSALAAMIAVSETMTCEAMVDHHPELEPVREYLRRD